MEKSGWPRGIRDQSDVLTPPLCLVSFGSKRQWCHEIPACWWHCPRLQMPSQLFLSITNLRSQNSKMEWGMETVIQCYWARYSQRCFANSRSESILAYWLTWRALAHPWTGTKEVDWTKLLEKNKVQGVTFLQCKGILKLSNAPKHIIIKLNGDGVYKL